MLSNTLNCVVTIQVIRIRTNRIIVVFQLKFLLSYHDYPLHDIFSYGNYEYDFEYDVELYFIFKLNSIKPV